MHSYILLIRARFSLPYSIDKTKFIGHCGQMFRFYCSTTICLSDSRAFIGHTFRMAASKSPRIGSSRCIWWCLFLWSFVYFVTEIDGRRCRNEKKNALLAIQLPSQDWCPVALFFYFLHIVEFHSLTVQKGRKFPRVLFSGCKFLFWCEFECVFRPTRWVR